MAWEFRRPLFDLQGALVVGIGSGDTQIRSSRFTSLPTDYSTGSYLPLTITDDTGSEVVWVTGHSTASDGVTVTRGREGTTARAFDATAVVRCTPTLRDVVSAVATRAALPSDGHYGCRVLIIGEGQVVERTSAGWNDSAPFEDDNARKHRWYQGGADIGQASTMIQAVGMSATQNGTTGTIATQSGGSLTLNRAGHWAIRAQMFMTSSQSRNQGVQFAWSQGAFPGIDTLFNITGAIGGSGVPGNAITQIEWSGYVSATEATKPIILSVYSTVASGAGACNYNLFAEYEGA